jgi:hypothetical protein
VFGPRRSSQERSGVRFFFFGDFFPTNSKIFLKLYELDYKIFFGAFFPTSSKILESLRIDFFFQRFFPLNFTFLEKFVDSEDPKIEKKIQGVMNQLNLRLVQFHSAAESTTPLSDRYIFDLRIFIPDNQNPQPNRNVQNYFFPKILNFC